MVALTFAAVGGEYDGTTAEYAVTVVDDDRVDDLEVTVVDDDRVDVLSVTIRLEQIGSSHPSASGWGFRSSSRGTVENEFSYGGIGYAISSFYFVPDLHVSTPEQSRFVFKFGSSPPPSEAHTAEWTLHVGTDVELSFSDAQRLGDNGYVWKHAEFEPFRAGMDVTFRLEQIPESPKVYTPIAFNRPASGTPTINGTVNETAEVGDTLTIDTSNITDLDGMTSSTFRYYWTGSYGDGPSFTLPSHTVGETIGCEVTFTDDAGNRERVICESKIVVQVSSTRVTTLEAQANEDGSIALTWNTPANKSVTGYQILRLKHGERQDTPQTLVADTGNTKTTYNDASVSELTLYTYQIRAITPNRLGILSNTVIIQTRRRPRNPGVDAIPQVDQQASVDPLHRAVVFSIAGGQPHAGGVRRPC